MLHVNGCLLYKKQPIFKKHFFNNCSMTKYTVYVTVRLLNIPSTFATLPTNKRLQKDFVGFLPWCHSHHLHNTSGKVDNSFLFVSAWSMFYREEDFQQRRLHLLHHNFCNVNKMSKPKTILYTNIRWGGNHLQEESVTVMTDFLR